MARTVASVIENNFSKGLITEATALQFPEHSVVEAFDCEFDVLGKASRRLGFDYEYGYTTKQFNKIGSVINTYVWKNVTGDGLISFVVVQIGATLLFYSADTGVASLSGGLASSTIDLSIFAVPSGLDPRTAECQFADGLSRLYVVNPGCNNFFVTFNPSTGVFTGTQYDLTIRDFAGVTDPNALTTRPAALGANDNHRYNLYNQGWTASLLTTWNTAKTNYPSNADVWQNYKNASDVFDPATTEQYTLPGNSPAPRGHFILSVYNGNRDAASGLSGITSTTSNNARSSCTTFFAGRTWYSGIAAPGYNSKVYFSQIIADDTSVGKCYQANDPTSELLFTLNPDDGGVISIPEAGTIYRLFAMQSGLLVFAYRGVWLITGSTGLGFFADDFVVSRISSVRTISGTSLVDVNGSPIWWNAEGIWTVTGNANGSGGITVQSMTRSTIQTFYDEIPTTSKLTARGVFDQLNQIVYWLYTSTEASVIEDQYIFDRVLVFNALSGAFYPWTISSGGPQPNVHGIVLIDGTGGITVEDIVIDNAAETVVTDAGDTVVGYELTNRSVSPKVKYFTSVSDQSNYELREDGGYERNIDNTIELREYVSTSLFTWSETLDPSFTDWVTSGQKVNYDSYFITGYRLYTQALQQFQTNYVLLYHEGTGGCYIQGIWDFAVSQSTGRFNNMQLARFDDNAYSNNHKKFLMRGQGRSLQYKISSHSSDPFNVIGWAVQGSGEQKP